MKPGRPSFTARRVALARATMQRVPADYGDPAEEDRLNADLGAGIAATATGRGALGFMFRYLTARTRFFDTQTVTAIDAGITQIVITGAGYDGRALRYAKPGVRYFELDHSDTQRDKLARLAKLNIDVGSVAFATADFRLDDVDAVLFAAGHDRAVPSLFVCEGVTGYIERPALARLFGALATAGAPGSRFAVNFRVRDPSEPRWRAARRAALDGAVSALGEPPKSDFTAAEVGPFMQASGWAVTEAIDPAANPVPLPRFVVATRA
ncbi:MAG: class I SAM-dependent methyltransferase [Acidimicrobiales bacterium]